jgi:RNase adapter protein RapZ
VSDFLVVAGLSGAGRSTAAAALEDVGWFVIDNLPPALITKVAELVTRGDSELERVALVMGRGGGDHYRDVIPALEALTAQRHRVRVLFLTAPDDVLVRRFDASRRPHPLASRGVEESVVEERALLEPLHARADITLDTGDLNVNQLRARVVEMFGESDAGEHMQISILSFGFKHGVPLDVDLLFDCRFLANPHWDEALRPMSGLDEPVRAFVLARPEAFSFLDKVVDLLVGLIPAYAREGKSYLTVALGCTGGRHRSVVLTEELAGRLESSGISTAAFHRDIER